MEVYVKKLADFFRDMYRVAQKVSLYYESSLNRIKTVIEARFFVSFEYKMNRRYYMFIFNTLCAN